MSVPAVQAMSGGQVRALQSSSQKQRRWTAGRMPVAHESRGIRAHIVGGSRATRCTLGLSRRAQAMDAVAPQERADVGAVGQTYPAQCLSQHPRHQPFGKRPTRLLPNGVQTPPRTPQGVPFPTVSMQRHRFGDQDSLTSGPIRFCTAFETPYALQVQVDNELCRHWSTNPGASPSRMS